MFFLFAYWVLPQPAPIVRAFYLNVNAIITAGDATAGVSLPVCLVPSVCLSVCLCPSLLLSQPLLLSFPQLCLTAIIMCLPNGIHSVAGISIFLGLTFYHSFPTHSDCNGRNGESSLLLSCLSIHIVYSRSPDSVGFWLALGKWTLWHFTPWNVAAHGITCKHCSLLPWQLMTEIQPSRTCLCQDCTQTGLSNFRMFRTIKAERLCSFSIFLSCAPLSICPSFQPCNQVHFTAVMSA